MKEYVKESVKKCLYINKVISEDINNKANNDRLSISKYIELCFLYFIDNCKYNNKVKLYENLKEKYYKNY